MYHIVKTVPNSSGGHYLGVYKGPAADAAEQFDGVPILTDVTTIAEAAIATLSAHSDEAMWDLAKTIANPREGFLDKYEMSAIFMQQALAEYAEFAKAHPIFEEVEDLLFRDFVEEHVVRGRYLQQTDQLRVEWICRTICGRPGAPAELNTWFPTGWEEAA